MDAVLLRDEKEIREPLENLGMEFHVYHDWALTQSVGFFTVAKSKAEFLTAAFDLHFKKSVNQRIKKAKDTVPSEVKKRLDQIREDAKDSEK